MELSWIQKHILFVLVRQASARSKDLIPADVEANLFAYHLKGLLKNGLIERSGRGVYTLSANGEKFVGTLSTVTRKVTDNIKTVIMLWARRGDKTLFFRWSRQPYLGKATLPYDRVAFGTALGGAITKALADKIGVPNTGVEYTTSALIKIQKGEETISHMNALVYKLSDEIVEDAYKARNGVTIWGDEYTDGLMNGVAEFVVALDSGQTLIEATWRY